jgi:4-hydroxy-tetrahydrodipicolinate synthase
MTVDLHGVHVAMSTAFCSDESLDEGRFKFHIDLLIDAGVHGIVLNSGTGEFAYMSDSEAQRIVEIGVAHINGRVAVTAQTSTVSLKHCIAKSKAAVDAGVDAVMVLPPWLEGPFAAGVMHHYLRLADEVDTTLVLYNIPAVSGVEVTPEMWAELSAHPNIGHIKDSTGDIAKMQSLTAAGPGVLGGCDPVAPFALAAGAQGWIWGAANVMPHECVALYNLFTAGQHDAAFELWRTKMFPFNSYVWENPHDAEYITTVKTAASMRFGDLGPVREPQLPLGDEVVDAIAATIAVLG